MSNSYWLWNGIIYCFLLVNILHVGVDGRRYDKCSTPDGREGICVVRRYCREASSQYLISCDDDNNYCCPIPTTHRSAPSQPLPSPSVPPEEPPTKRPQGDRPRNGDQNPRKPLDVPVRDHHTTSNKQRTDNSYGRPRYDERIDDDRKRTSTVPGKVRFDDEPPRYNGDKRTTNRDRDHPPIDLYDDRKPVKPSTDRRDDDDGRGPFISNNDNPAAKRRNQTDRPSHYPSRDNIGPSKDINQNRIPKPLSHNDTYQDLKPSKLPSIHEVLSSQPNKVPACGVKPYELFIAGGEESKAHEWPWMTAIFRRHQSSRPKTFLCGGSLINTKYVLTAAHCFVNNYVILPASSFVVRLGSHYLNSGEEYTVSNLVIHSNHSGSDFFNDIALVRLASEVYTTDKIAPICLPFPDMMYDNLVDRIATVAGWGDTAFRTAGSRALQHVSVPIVSTDECFAAYSRVRGAAFLARGSDHVICAGLREGGKDACLGDSGGPLMLKVSDDRWVIVGIVSLGYKCAEPGYPGVYTKITHYMSWIQDNMKPY